MDVSATGAKRPFGPAGFAFQSPDQRQSPGVPLTTRYRAVNVRVCFCRSDSEPARPDRISDHVALRTAPYYGCYMRIRPEYQVWIDARKRQHLSHAQVQMARELGMNPKKLGKLDNDKQEPWKLPLPQFM